MELLPPGACQQLEGQLKYARRDLQDLDQLRCYGDPTMSITTLQEEVQAIHFSHYAPFLRTLTSGDIRLFLSAFSQKQLEGLKQMLLFSVQIPRCSLKLSQFVCKKLLHELRSHSVFPVECLPESPFNLLLSWTNQELNLLCDLFGIYDIALEIRHIIDTQKLRKIYQALSEEQNLYLKKILQQKEPVRFSPMGLTLWDGNEEQLCQLIQKRGMSRLAKALCGSHPSFLWHLTHRFEVSRAALFSQFQTHPEPLETHKALIQELLFLLPSKQSIFKKRGDA